MPDFYIHPADLEQRRKRCVPEHAALLKLQREVVTSCNVCGSPRHAILNTRDRYGLPFRNAVCLDCGLFYLIDRFTFNGYSDFYGTGAYRTISCEFNGVTHTIAQVQADQASYARNLTGILSGFVPRHSGKLLDVGGSAGIIAREFVKQLGLQATVLDPATDEIAAARQAGLDAVVGSIEDWQTDEKFDLILLCRSIEHLFDLRFAMGRIRSLLKPDGLFFVDIADFMEMCRMMGSPQTFTKVDHCYWLTQSTSLDIFRRIGFDVVSMNIVSSFGYVGFLLRACEPATPAVSSAARVLSQVEEIQAIERNWLASAAKARGPVDWARRKAYRAKRRVIRAFSAKSSVQQVAPHPAPQATNVPAAAALYTSSKAQHNS
jgi:SAM-dependent methyltransferase